MRIGFSYLNLKHAKRGSLRYSQYASISFRKADESQKTQ